MRTPGNFANAYLSFMNLSRILLFLLPCSALANDGAFYASGSTLFPIKETVIQLKKEHLGIVIDRLSEKKLVYVTVDFTFYNPGEEKELTVGFVTPPASGDVNDEGHPQISAFTAVVNNDTMPWKVWRCDSSGFRIRDTLSEGYDFVYFFKALFRKGENKIRHTYRFRAAAGVDWEYHVPYRITTGRLWANNEIEDFTLEISIPGGDHFHVPWSFHTDERPAEWTIDGLGKLGKGKSRLFNSEEEPWVRTATIGQNGKIIFKAMHFRPERDLFFKKFIFLKTIEPLQNSDFAYDFNMITGGHVDPAMLQKLSDEEIAYVKNALFAFHGYVFKNKKWKDIFSRYEWYLPDPSVKSEAAVLSSAEQRVLKSLLEEEKRRKKKK